MSFTSDQAILSELRLTKRELARIDENERQKKQKIEVNAEKPSFDMKGMKDPALALKKKGKAVDIGESLSKRKNSSIRPTSTSSLKSSKGLRHFSLKVCQKVEKKQITSYNEVADELVNDYWREKAMGITDVMYDEKNIRRRVYDALNVLMAMDIISKDKKDIRWKGLRLPSPIACSGDQEMNCVKVEQTERLRKVEEKRKRLNDLVLERMAYEKLIKRNEQVQPPLNAALAEQSSRISLPFLLVCTDQGNVIQCEMSEDRKDIFFNFDGPFVIQDDTEILKKIGLQTFTTKELSDNIPKRWMHVFSQAFSDATQHQIMQMLREQSTSARSAAAAPAPAPASSTPFPLPPPS